MSNDSSPLLIRSREKTRNVHKGNNRNIERITKANETSSFGGTQFHVKNSGDANTTTRKGYMRFDTGGVLGGSVTSASLDLVVSLTAVTANQTIHVYGLTDETLDSWDPSSATWAGAPANNVSSGHLTDPAKASLLGTFVVTSADVAGTVKSFSNPALISFLNNDTNGSATIILGRTPAGTSGGANLLFAGDTHASLSAPRLTLEATAVPESSSLSLALIGLLGAVGLRRVRR